MASAAIGGQEALMDRADRGLVGQMECDPVGRDRADPVAPAALAQDRAADHPVVPGNPDLAPSLRVERRTQNQL
jgi:hypothetical protein